MSFLVGGAILATGGGLAAAGTGAAVGAMIGKTLMGGFGAQTKDEVADQEKYAEQMKQEQLGLLGEQKGIALKSAQSQFAGASRDVGFGLQTGKRDIAYTTGKSNLATSGTMQTQTGDLMNKYKSDMTKLFETRDLSKAAANLSYRQGEMSAEDAYQNTLTDINSQPTGFLEGMFS
jgi:hypothetical protein